ncbi:hypothetical protein DYB37_010057 [Aphanomyces astaci]|uniref:Uncharacterized protein n=1 Tax=Aphanomyces astaci TaxID=112090 RepID=A0A397DNJ8_APHAT|nr:hypothetical protein DYB34_007484 [Aphanomyces astaci]RHY68397.1 hypothetical protein DYB30_005106 [Aphanomyces astaci]RHY94533.1 hypothetical protein DYB35_009650 [Aphanomyces astaci]RHZ24255.1 hypothetical protein DYB37_010057 [Aphanomyces astaci]RHZ25237.1 hypothetical protein DYB31_011610 [Aphanomyces astaci]
MTLKFTVRFFHPYDQQVGSSPPAAMGKAGASIGSYGCSLWVKDPSFGYDGALFYTFAGISLATIVLTWFCMFGNNESS